MRRPLYEAEKVCQSPVEVSAPANSPHRTAKATRPSEQQSLPIDRLSEDPKDPRELPASRFLSRSTVDATLVAQPDDHEILRLLLSYSQSAASVSALLERFPSIGHVVSAEAFLLGSLGLTARDVVLLQLVHEVALRMTRGQIRNRCSISNWKALLDYLAVVMAYEPIEHFRVLFLDAKNNLIADELQGTGTVDHTPVYPREVVKRALLLNASALVVVHNHPSGDPTPSADDREMTQQLKAAADVVGLKLHDHVVVGHGRHFSFRTSGLL